MQQPMLTFLEQPCHATHILERKTRLARDVGFIVASLLQPLDVVQQVDRPVWAPGKILNQAHDHAVFLIDVDNERGISFWPKHLYASRRPCPQTASYLSP